MNNSPRNIGEDNGDRLSNVLGCAGTKCSVETAVHQCKATLRSRVSQKASLAIFTTSTSSLHRRTLCVCASFPSVHENTPKIQLSSVTYRINHSSSMFQSSTLYPSKLKERGSSSSSHSSKLKERGVSSSAVGKGGATPGDFIQAFSVCL